MTDPRNDYTKIYLSEPLGSSEFLTHKSVGEGFLTGTGMTEQRVCQQKAHLSTGSFPNWKAGTTCRQLHGSENLLSEAHLVSPLPRSYLLSVILGSRGKYCELQFSFPRL